jgi:hypothetical protein
MQTFRHRATIFWRKRELQRSGLLPALAVTYWCVAIAFGFCPVGGNSPSSRNLFVADSWWPDLQVFSLPYFWSLAGGKGTRHYESQSPPTKISKVDFELALLFALCSRVLQTPLLVLLSRKNIGTSALYSASVHHVRAPNDAATLHQTNSTLLGTPLPPSFPRLQTPTRSTLTRSLGTMFT